MEGFHNLIRDVHFAREDFGTAAPAPLPKVAAGIALSSHEAFWMSRKFWREQEKRAIMSRGSTVQEVSYE